MVIEDSLGTPPAQCQERTKAGRRREAAAGDSPQGWEAHAFGCVTTQRPVSQNTPQGPRDETVPALTSHPGQPRYTSTLRHRTPDLSFLFLPLRSSSFLFLFLPIPSFIPSDSDTTQAERCVARACVARVPAVPVSAAFPDAPRSAAVPTVLLLTCLEQTGTAATAYLEVQWTGVGRWWRIYVRFFRLTLLFPSISCAVFSGSSSSVSAEANLRECGAVSW